MSPFDSLFCCTTYNKLHRTAAFIHHPQVCTPGVAVGHAQLTYVRTRAEADSLARARGVECFHSRQCYDENIAALRALSSGNPIIATYGLGVGVNLMSNGQPISTVDHHGQFVCECECKLCKRACVCRCVCMRLKMFMTMSDS